MPAYQVYPATPTVPPVALSQVLLQQPELAQGLTSRFLRGAAAGELHRDALWPEAHSPGERACALAGVLGAIQARLVQAAAGVLARQLARCSGVWPEGDGLAGGGEGAGLAA